MASVGLEAMEATALLKEGGESGDVDFGGGVSRPLTLTTSAGERERVEGCLQEAVTSTGAPRSGARPENTLRYLQVVSVGIPTGRLRTEPPLWDRRWGWW